MPKTNAVRILESNKIFHTTHDYEVDENDLSGISVAGKIGADPDTVFKTLVVTGDKNGVNIFCIPVTAELNLKKAAAASGNKKIELLKVKDLPALTGYVRGGCSPIGMKKNYPAYIDETAQVFDRIFVSAGTRGTQVCLSPFELKNLINALFSDLI